MGKPRILLGAESLQAGNGGICRVARLMARVLAEEVGAGNLEASAVALSDAEIPNDIGLPIKVKNGSRAKFAGKMAWGAVSHTHFIYDFVGMARAHCRIPPLCRPMLIYLHGIEIWEGTRLDRIKTARRADALLVNSAYTLARVERTFGKFDVTPKVCWLATEANDAPETEVDSNCPPTVMILARMDEGGGYKGHRELIAAWPRVVDAVPDARLVMVGRGVGFDAVKELVAANRAGGSIEMKGFVPDAEVEKLWAKTAVLAMPSHKEGFGLVYIEAMRHSVPVIASIHDAAPEVNIDGQTGYNVNIQGNLDELSDRLIDLLRNRDRAAAMGRRGFQRWQEHFRYSAFRDRFRTALSEYLR